jgi:hypothetical protein
MNDKLKHIITKLKLARRLETAYNFIAGLFSFLSITLLLFLFVTATEALVQGDVAFRTTLFFIFAISLALAFYYLLLPELLRIFGIKFRPDIDEIARRVGQIYPEIKDKLINALQLMSNQNSNAYTSQKLSYAYFDEVYIKTKNKDFNKIINKRRTVKAFYLILLTTFFSGLIFIIFSGTLSASLERVMNFRKEYIPPAPFSLKLLNNDTIITRGNTLTIKIKATGVAPLTVELNLKEKQQENFDKITLNSDSAGFFTYTISSIKKSIEFFAQSPWYNSMVKTRTGHIDVIERPLIRSISGKLFPPAYTGRVSRNFTERNADISALKGSRIMFTLFSGTELAKAQLIFIPTINQPQDTVEINPDTVKIPFEVKNKQAYGELKIRQNGKYYFKLYDKNGIDNEKPIVYDIIALDDESPEIELVEPTFDVQVSEEALLPTLINITDDYGFSGLYLNYKLIHSKYTEPDRKFSKIKIPINKPELSQQIPYIWDLNEIGIAPEDVYEFYFEVYDNDIISGPKSAKTRVLKLRLPSLDEVLKSVDEMQNDLEKEAKELLKKTREIKEEMNKMKRELIKKPKGSQLDWKEKKKAEDILKKQQELQKKIDDLQKKMQKMTQKLEENKAISPETLQKYIELQKLLKEVSTPELQRLQQQFQNAMNKMDPEIMRKMMENAKFNEEQFRKSIERTIKMLKRLQAEQKTDALQKRAEELLRKQEELNKQTENTNPSDKEKLDDLAKKQKNLQNELNKINKDLKELEELMKELDDMPMDALEEAKQDLNFEKTSSEMNNASSQLSKSKMNQASSSQKKATKNLKKFAQSMQNLKQKMRNKVSKEAMQKMQKAINNLLELSKQQEALKQQTANTNYSSTKIPDLQERQGAIEDGIRNVANELMELSHKSFAVTPEMGYLIGQAMQNMEKAQQNLNNRAVSASAHHQKQAMSSINQAISQMQSMLSQMKKSGQGSCNNPGGEGQGQGGSGMSFSQRLRQTAKQQQGINNSMQQLLGQQMNQGKLTPQQQAELGRIAAEQGKARKALEDLAKEQEKFGGKKKALGDLNKIVKEMEEVISDLQSGDVTPETLNKQERVLSRLLDASVSMNERDYEKKRESKSAEQFQRKSPGPLSLDDSEARRKAIEEFNKSLKQGYAKDYQRLIKMYFEALQNPVGKKQN